MRRTTSYLAATRPRTGGSGSLIEDKPPLKVDDSRAGG
jgi:hypothetical protein